MFPSASTTRFTVSNVVPKRKEKNWLTTLFSVGNPTDNAFSDVNSETTNPSTSVMRSAPVSSVSCTPSIS